MVLADTACRLPPLSVVRPSKSTNGEEAGHQSGQDVDECS